MVCTTTTFRVKVIRVSGAIVEATRCVGCWLAMHSLSTIKMSDTNKIIVVIHVYSAALPYSKTYVFSSVQSLAHRDLCNGSPLHVETVHCVAAAVAQRCDAAASMPQPETLLEKDSSLVLQ